MPLSATQLAEKQLAAISICFAPALVMMSKLNFLSMAKFFFGEWLLFVKPMQIVFLIQIYTPSYLTALQWDVLSLMKKR